MAPHVNRFGQPIGAALPDWQTRPWPPRTAMTGRFCRVEPLVPERHLSDLYAAAQEDPEGRLWTYVWYGPFDTLDRFAEFVARHCQGEDPLFHAIVDQASGRALGMAAFLRIDPAAGVMEVGHVYFSPRLQRSAAATEAMYLMMRRAFGELGYRRYEWKCDALNGPSRAAAGRLGFRFEGIFRQAAVYKQRSRDTAWFSVIDGEWPALKAAFERWLDLANFDAGGRQRASLSSFRNA
jgi:RimJ/RimL family protein N-acetyltransferase